MIPVTPEYKYLYHTTKMVLCILRYIIQILNAASEAEYNEALKDVEDMVIIAGCFPLTQKFCDREVLVQSLCRFYMIDRVSVATEQ